MHKDLIVVKNFITSEEEIELINSISSLFPCKTTKDRENVWRFGRYRHSVIGVVEQIPLFLENISDRILSNNYLNTRPDSISINEYLVGQGSSPHVDSLDNGNIITILSLGSQVVMDFSHKRDNFSLLFPARCLVQLKDSIRYEYQHSIKANNYDLIDGKKVLRSKRYSIVFRNSIFK